MSKSLVLVTALVLAGCETHSPIPMQKISPVIVKNEGKPLFSIPVPEGRWFMTSSGKKTMMYGFVDLEGVFPDSNISHSIRIGMESMDDSPTLLSDMLPSLKSENYQAYLKSILNWYTPARKQERSIAKLDGKVIKFNGFFCRDFWYVSTVAPHTHDGKGIDIYESSIACPLVVDGHIYRFYMGSSSSIGAWYYNTKAEYDKNKKPTDPEFPANTDQLLKRLHGEELLSGLGDLMANLFSGIQFYGKVSQNYADIANPELLQKKIDDQVPYQPRELKK